jgi:hypothetical protein
MRRPLVIFFAIAFAYTWSVRSSQIVVQAPKNPREEWDGAVGWPKWLLDSDAFALAKAADSSNRSR